MLLNKANETLTIVEVTVKNYNAWYFFGHHTTNSSLEVSDGLIVQYWQCCQLMFEAVSGVLHTAPKLAEV